MSLKEEASKLNSLIFSNLNELEEKIKAFFKTLLEDTITGVKETSGLVGKVLDPLANIIKKTFSEKGIEPITRLIFKLVSEGIMLLIQKLKDKYTEDIEHQLTFKSNETENSNSFITFLQQLLTFDDEVEM